jgi:hypothetical protein
VLADQQRSRWIEAAVAVVVSAAALATTWCSFQATLWNGQQAVHYNRAGAMRTIATGDAIDASVTRSVEIGLFTAWLDAKHTHNEALAQFYQARLPPGLKPAFDEWLTFRPLTNSQAPPSPFTLASYRQPRMAEARALEEKSEAEFGLGQRANHIGDAYTRSAVILALAMFFGGVGQAFQHRPVRIVMAGVALVACILGLAFAFTLPMLTVT